MMVINNYIILKFNKFYYIKVLSIMELLQKCGLMAVYKP